MSAQILVVANKWWEVTPLLSVLMSARARPVSIANASFVLPNSAIRPEPRMLCEVKSKTVEIWCIQDLMDPTLNESLSWEKARVLPWVLKDRRQPPELVIAFGTAANPADSDRNGNVIVGTKVFLHDPYKTCQDRTHLWTHPLLDRVIDSEASLPAIPSASALEIEKRMLRCPNASAAPLAVTWGKDIVGISVVNVTDRDQYWKTDRSAMAAFAACGTGVPASLETTHGVIRLVLDRPFLFVSGIANRVGRFAQENAPNLYAQNFVAAHNAALAVSWLLEHVA